MRVGLLWSDPRRHRWDSAAVASVPQGAPARYAAHFCSCGDRPSRPWGSYWLVGTRAFSSSNQSTTDNESPTCLICRWQVQQRDHFLSNLRGGNWVAVGGAVQGNLPCEHPAPQRGKPCLDRVHPSLLILRVAFPGLSGFPNARTLSMTRSYIDDGLIGQPPFEENWPCIARRRPRCGVRSGPPSNWSRPVNDDVHIDSLLSNST